MDPTLLTLNQRNGIVAWAKLIRSMDEDRAVRFLTRIVANLASDEMALANAMKATDGQPMN